MNFLRSEYRTMPDDLALINTITSPITPIVSKFPYEEDEDILKENPYRYTLFPVAKPELYKRYKHHISVFWHVDEVDLSKDMKDWQKLTPNERHFIKHVLGFFAGSDGIVNENLSTRFSREVQLPEARAYYSIQMAIETIHCVAPETKILTDKGYIEIQTLKDQKANVWNGEEFSEVTVVNTSPMAKLIKVKLSNGMILECTEEHKWLIRKGPDAHPEQCKIERVLTKDLKINDIIGTYSLPVIDITDPDEFKNPYTHGFFCGDGTYANKYPCVTLYGEKQKLLPYLEVSSICPEESRNRTNCYLTNKINKDKYVVPINYSIKTKLDWLAGYVDADGCIKKSKKGLTTIQVGSINKEFLMNIQLMLNTIGIHGNIRKNKVAEKRIMPDGKGGVKEYECQELWVLYLTCDNVYKLVQLGFTPHRLQIITDEIIANPSLIRIEEIIDEGRMSPTYCFNEPKKHAGIFNGILTGQSEQYALLIDTYITDPEEKLQTLRAIQTIPSVQLKAEWAAAWIDSEDADFATRLIGFAAVEGIFFSGSFCAIFWLKQRGLMPGLTVSNEFISRDEGLHTDFACALFQELKHKPAKEKVHQILKEAVNIEKHFITKALPCELIGMNAELMSQYIEFVADRLSKQLGYGSIYGTANPFDFMERLSLEGKDNFFEKRVTTYAKAGVGSTTEQKRFALDEDF